MDEACQCRELETMVAGSSAVTSIMPEHRNYSKLEGEQVN